MSRVIEVADDFPGTGVPVVWVPDPVRKTAYVMDANGLRQVMGEIEAMDGELRLPLAEIFSDDDIEVSSIGAIIEMRMAAKTQTLLTLEDILALPDRDDCRYEVEDGELIEVSLPRPEHQTAASNLVIDLGVYLRANLLGRVYSSGTPFLLKTDPITLRGPDAAVILNANLGKVHPREFIQGAPDVAIEVSACLEEFGYPAQQGRRAIRWRSY